MTVRRPVRRNLEIEQGSNFTFARRLYHRDLSDNLTLFDSSEYAARFTVRQRDWDGDVVVAADEGDYITLGFTPAPWEATTAYVVGQFAIPTTSNGFVYQVSTAGTSHSGEPTWPTALNATVNDGSVVWTCISTDSWVANLFIHLPSSYTESLEDWGAGVYDIELEDSFGNVQRLYQGSAWLSRETSYT